MNEVKKVSVQKRLRRIEGQVAGVTRMVEEDRYCIDVLHQLRAVRAALQKAEEEILRDHMHPCVASALRSNDQSEKERKVDELIKVVRELTH